MRAGKWKEPHEKSFHRTKRHGVGTPRPPTQILSGVAVIEKVYQ